MSNSNALNRSIVAEKITVEEAYKQYRTRVFAVCYRMLKNVEDAEDVTQDVFIRLNSKIHLFRGESAFTTWLHAITVNEVLMWIRKNKRRKESTVSRDDDTIYNVEPTIDYPLVENLFLNTAFRKLPKGYFNVIYLHDVLGYEHDQIGHVLGVSSGTSKSQIHKARNKMKKLINLKANPRIYNKE